MSAMNVAAAALLRNPYPLYRVMRRFLPLFHDRRRRLWLLFDDASIRSALGDPQTFSSRAAPPGQGPLDWLIFLDPPLHTRLRGLVMSSFTPSAIAGLAPAIHKRAASLLDGATNGEDFDVVSRFAEPLPLMVIAELLGIPYDPRLRVWTDAILHLGDVIAGGDVAARAIRNFAVAKAEMRPFVLALLQQRRAAPAADLLTRLAEAQVGGERLSDDDILGFFYLLLLAGSETTTNLLGNAIVCLLQNPKQLARLRREPDLVGATIEEVLRYRSPVQLVFRVTTRPVELHGKTIPGGELVLLMIGAANRDPRTFERAEVFDIGRKPGHIAFGHGAHFCIGAMLARLEASIALPKLLALGDFRLSGREAWLPRAAVNVHGPARLVVRFTRATQS